MSLYYFQIKGKMGAEEYSVFGGNWSFPPIWSDVIEADDKQDARNKIDAEYGKKFPLRVLSKDLDTNEFLLSVKEVRDDDQYFKRLLEVRTCTQCKIVFKLLDKYQIANGGGHDFCSRDCYDKYCNEHKPDSAGDFFLDSYPVIYKITNTVTNKVYIGKTRRSFTLRWWEHIKATSDSKFHTALREQPLSNWTFQVIEVHPSSITEEELLERERWHIQSHRSIKEGYNSI